MRRWRSALLVGLSVLGVGTLVLLFLRERGDPNAFFLDHAKSVRKAVTPPEGRVLAISDVARDAYSISMTWDIEMTSDWSSYSKWIERQLLSDYRLIRAEPSRSAFARTSGGDSYSLDVAPVSSGTPLRVHVEFRAHAD